MHEPGLLDILIDMTEPGDWFLDVGAHQGMYTRGMQAAGRRVLAVEGDPDADPGCETLRLVAWDRPTKVSRVTLGPLPGSVGFVEDPDGEYEAGPVTVDRPFRLVKVDVEGAEVRVLLGMQALIDKHHPRFVIETHEQLVKGIAIETTTLLESHGYEVKVGYHWGGSDYLFAT